MVAKGGKFGKSSVSVSQLKTQLEGCAGRRWDFPPSEVRGVFRYTRIHVDIYSVYVETIKKFKGLAKYQGGLYADCTLKDLQNALKDESKDRRRK